MRHKWMLKYTPIKGDPILITTLKPFRTRALARLHLKDVFPVPTNADIRPVKVKVKTTYTEIL